jgi:outer membrane immunogenic protein
MRSVFAAGGLAALLAAPAMAADMRVKAQPPVVAPYSWSGFYIGGTAGAAWGHFNTSSTTIFDPDGYFFVEDIPVVDAAGRQRIKSSGFTGGVEAGFNWQLGSLVFGLEADIQSFKLGGSVNSGLVPYPSVLSFTLNANASTNWLATGRGRIGIASNNWLFFATGGVAFTELHANFLFTDTFPVLKVSPPVSTAKIGGVIGGGVEVGLSQGWTVKAEYLFVSFGKAKVVGDASCTFSGGIPCDTAQRNVFTHTADLSANVVRVGLNYRLGGLVVARD